MPASSIGSAGLPTDLRRWMPVGLSGTGASFSSDYSAATSPMAKAIACYTNSSTGTDLTDPIPMAAYELMHNGRAGVNKGIILMSDGQPNASTTSTSNYCLQANTAATAAKAQGIEIFTVGFGLDGSNDIACPDTSGAWKGKMASALLASMATTSVAEAGCPDHREHRQRPLLLRSEDGRRLRRPLERIQDGGHVARAGNQARRAPIGLVRADPARAATEK